MSSKAKLQCQRSSKSRATKNVIARTTIGTKRSHIGRNVQSDVVESNTQSDIDQEDAILRAFFLDDEISQTHVEESVPFNPEQSTISEALQSDIEISVMSSPGAPTIPSLMSLPFSESDLEWNIGYCSGKRTRRIGIDKGKTQFL